MADKARTLTDKRLEEMEKKLRVNHKGQQKKENAMMKMKVTGGSLNVREKPSTKAEIKHILAEGEEITVAEEENDWYKFGSGYVMAKWLTPVQEEDTAPVIDENEKPKKTPPRKTRRTTGKSTKKEATE